MKSEFYSIEKGEKWLTPFEKRQWREKFRALQLWFQNKGIEISPWLQVHLRELLIVTFFIQRLEQELLLSPIMTKSENEKGGGGEPNKKSERINSANTCYEIVCKYLERQRKLVQELEEIKPSNVKTSPMSIAELVQDLVRCAHELDNGNGKLKEYTIQTEEKNHVIADCGIQI